MPRELGSSKLDPRSLSQKQEASFWTLERRDIIIAIACVALSVFNFYARTFFCPFGLCFPRKISFLDTIIWFIACKIVLLIVAKLQPAKATNVLEVKQKDPASRLERRVEKALEACSKLGQNCMESTGKGCHGSQFIKSLKGKRVGVFKAIPEKSGYYNPFSQKAYLHQEPIAEAAAERASYLLANELKNPYLTVPPVKIMELNGKKGSFAVYEKGTPADSIIHEVDKKPYYSENELNIFQIFALFDKLLGNLDRKLENWLIDWHKQIKVIYPIDNSNAFPTQIPSRWRNPNAAKNVYKWKDLRIASIPFTQAMKNFIEETITEDNLKAIIQKINGDEQILSLYPKGFLVGKSLQEFNSRATETKRLLAVKNDLSPKDLAV